MLNMTFIHSFIHSFIPSVSRSFVRSFIYLFIYLFIHSFTHSYKHAVHPSIHPCIIYSPVSKIHRHQHIDTATASDTQHHPRLSHLDRHIPDYSCNWMSVRPDTGWAGSDTVSDILVYIELVSAEKGSLVGLREWAWRVEDLSIGNDVSCWCGVRL